MPTFCLYEAASGYALFQVKFTEDIGSSLDEVKKSISELPRFSKMVKLVSFAPFTSAEDALKNINALTEGDMTETLKNFLEMHLPKV
eukprot:1301855-Amorphochlora_amoeboformis.AAC.1